LARPGVRGTFSQPGPSRLTATVRLARTLCRTKCLHAGSNSFLAAALAHGKRVSVTGRGNRESNDAKNKPLCAPDGPEDSTWSSQTSTLQGSRLRSGHAGQRTTENTDAGQSCHQFGECKQEVKLLVHAVVLHRASHSKPLGRGSQRSVGVPPLFCRQPRPGCFCGAPRETAMALLRVKAGAA
jgi:hypothetical protein